MRRYAHHHATTPLHSPIVRPEPCLRCIACAQGCSVCSSTSSPRASVAPAASGCAYGSRRRSAAAAEEAHKEEEDGWADEVRGMFREHEGRRALVDGNAHRCGQDQRAFAVWPGPAHWKRATVCGSGSRSRRPRARCGARCSRPLRRWRSSMCGCASGCVTQPHENAV